MTLRGDFAMSFCNTQIFATQIKYLISLLPLEMSLRVFPQEWGWAGKGCAPSPMDALRKEMPSDGSLWVMEKETQAAGSGVQSGDRSEHVPWPRQWHEEELSLQIEGERADSAQTKKLPVGQKDTASKGNRGGTSIQKALGSSHSLRDCHV